MNPSLRTSQQLMEACSPIKEQLLAQTLAVELRMASETSPQRGGGGAAAATTT